MEDETSSKAKLYFDGTCPMCTAFAAHVEKHSAPPTLIDATRIENPPAPITAMLDEIHLYEADGNLRTGADAVFTTLARSYSWLIPVRDLFRLPGLRNIARFCYRFIARRRKLWFGSEASRLYWVYLITNIGLLLGVLLSWPLWGSERTYPLVPVSSILEPMTAYSGLLACALLVSLFTSLITITRHSLTACISTILLTLLVLTDQTRLQPWVWHYGIILALFSFWKPGTRVSNEHLTFALMGIVVGIYFWSGIQKITSAFFTEISPWLTNIFSEPFGLMGLALFLSLSIFIPLIESGIALGLLTARYRQVSLLCALAMLIFVLSTLIFGQGWNSLIWLWNITLFSMAVALFFGRTESLSGVGRAIRHNYFAHITIALFIIMPLGNFFGLTHHYVSWSLHSGHIPTAYLTTDTNLIRTLAPEASVIPAPDGQGTLSFVNFTMSTLNAVPYPETPLFRAIFKDLCLTYSDTDLTLSLVTRPRFLSHLTTVETFRCEDL